MFNVAVSLVGVVSGVLLLAIAGALVVALWSASWVWGLIVTLVILGWILWALVEVARGFGNNSLKE